MIVNAGTMMKSTFARAYPRHLILHDVYQKSADYRASIHDMRVRCKTRIILDNGAHEGIYPPLNEYLATAVELQPDVVVLTDIVGVKSNESQHRAMEFAGMIEKRFPKMQMMYAPQGETQDQILADYEWSINTLDPDRYIIGFGQSYLKWEDRQRGIIDEIARLEMVQSVMSLPNAARMTYHILGARWRPTGAFNVWSDVIVGLDTIKPCTCALEKVMYPRRPALNIDRYSNEVCDDTRLAQNVVALSERYELMIG